MPGAGVGYDQDLLDLLENPADTTRTSVPVLSSAVLSFLPRFDPGLANLFHSFEPCEVFSGGAERGTPIDASLGSVGTFGTEREAVLARVTRTGTDTAVGYL